MSSSGVAAIPGPQGPQGVPGVPGTLDENEIFVGDASNAPVSVPMSGDAEIIASGAVLVSGWDGQPLGVAYLSPSPESVPRFTGTQWTADIAASGGNPWTPTLTQSAAVAKTVNNATYIQIGNLVYVWCRLTPTAAGTANNAITVSVPVGALTAALFCGAGQMTLAGTVYRMNVILSTTGVFAFRRCDITGTANMGVDPNAALAAAGDLISFFAVYEAA